MHFTDDTRDTLEYVTINIKDCYQEYGYIPRAEAIPIEWIKKKIDNTSFFSEQGIYWSELLDDWEKENENNANKIGKEISTHSR